MEDRTSRLAELIKDYGSIRTKKQLAELCTLAACKGFHHLDFRDILTIGGLSERKWTVNEIWEVYYTAHARKIILDLEWLDLKESTETEIYETLNRIEIMPTFRFNLGIGRHIYRIRQLSPDEEVTNASSVSYCPPEFNKRYNRASTPSKTVFYGSVMPKLDDLMGAPLDGEIIVGLSEVCDFYRNPDAYEEGERRILISAWQLMKPLKVNAITFHDRLKSRSSFESNIATGYNKWFNENDQSYKKGGQILADYIASEFAREIPHGSEEFHYKLTALIAQGLLNNADDVNGLIYPSVQRGGKGMNIAIKPEFVDKNMGVGIVVDCKVSKERGKKPVITYERVSKFKNLLSPEFELVVLEEQNLTKEKVDSILINIP